MSTFDDLWDEAMASQKPQQGAAVSDRATAIPEKGSSFDDLWEEAMGSYKPKREGFEAFKKGPRSLARSGAAFFKSVPRQATGLLKAGVEGLKKTGLPLGDLERLGRADEALESFGAPTYEEALRDFTERVEGPNFEPSDIEKGFEAAGPIIAGGALSPGSLGTTALSALGAGTAGALGGEEGAQLGGAIALPAIVEAVNLIRTGKLKPSNSELKKLYEFGKQYGMTEAELAPILQSKGKQAFLGSMAERTERAGAKIKSSKDAFGVIYDDLLARGSQVPRATAKQTSELGYAFQKVSNDLKKSKLASSDKKAVISEIDGFIDNIRHNGIGADELLATWKDIGQSINWKNSKIGKKDLNSLKGPINRLLHDMDPQLASDFAKTNAMYSKLQETAKKVTPNQVTKILSAGKAGDLIVGMVSMAAGGPAIGIGTYLSKRGLGYLATEMLTNPRFNNSINKIISVASKGTKGAVRQAGKMLQKEFDQHPEFFEEDEDL